MSGSSRSMFLMAAINVRVAATSTYYPAHSKNGNNVDQRIQVRALGNVPSKANQGKGEQVGINVVAWGKLADVLARSMSLGKEFSIEMAPNVYKGQAYYKDPDHKDAAAIPVFIDTPAGRKPVMVEKTSYRIKKIIFGADSNDTIAREIQTGQRPAGWNIPGSADAAAWTTMLKARNEEQYTPGKATFGQSGVRVIEGPGIGAYDHTKTRANAVNTAAAVALAVAQAPAPAAAPAPALAPNTAVVSGM